MAKKEVINQIREARDKLSELLTQAYNTSDKNFDRIGLALEEVSASVDHTSKDAHRVAEVIDTTIAAETTTTEAHKKRRPYGPDVFKSERSG